MNQKSKRKSPHHLVNTLNFLILATILIGEANLTILKYVFINHYEDAFLKSLAWGPKKNVKKWPSYYVNGYKFNIKSHGQGMGSSNYGLYVQGGDNETINNDYYGILTDIIEVHCTGWPTKMLVLFKCD